ncbi:MAG: hypothetical protein A3F42_07735 [Gammaproteobacteria bacterium RIFCSPHIGHO2_12_FULL_37_34]|nr:MAG: hypothetical protein A3F42_07735 [Gammaproteobacteria bacterium RIFCSPHIGHO2_12_FULL_37_34]
MFQDIIAPVRIPITKEHDIIAIIIVMVVTTLQKAGEVIIRLHRIMVGIIVIAAVRMILEFIIAILKFHQIVIIHQRKRIEAMVKTVIQVRSK